MKAVSILTLAALLGTSMAAHAQAMKPGLWSTTTKVFGGPGGAGGTVDAMAVMQEQMAKLPPEQRKMMQEMMAKRGVAVEPNGTGGAGGGGGMSVKTCISQEMIDRNEIPAARGDCVTTKSPRVGNTMKIAFTCTKPPGSGEGLITFSGSDAYAMKMSVNTMVKGKPEKMDIEGSGQWLGASCGDIKPLVVPKN